MNSQLAINLATALIANSSLVIDTLLVIPVEDVIAEVLERELSSQYHFAKPGIAVCQRCNKPMSKWKGSDICPVV